MRALRQHTQDNTTYHRAFLAFRFLLKSIISMSDKCGDCDCADSSQCVKKGNSYGFFIAESVSYTETTFMDAMAAETDGKCKCGSSCSCTNCNCGAH